MFKLERYTIICSPSEQRGTTHVLVLLNFETTRLVRDCLSWTVRAHVARVIQIEVCYLSKAGRLLTPVGYTKGGVGVSDFSGWSDNRVTEPAQSRTPENHESACTIGPSADGVLAAEVSRLRSPQGLPDAASP